jgi:inosose dehydratase
MAEDRSDRSSSLSRRSFLQAAAGAAAAAALARTVRAAAPASAPSFKLGYAAITWGGDTEQAIDDISALGFHGIQLRSDVYDHYSAKAPELRRRLEDKGLALLCFSSGGIDADPEKEKEHLKTHLDHARFVKALGGEKLQVISRRPKDRAPTQAEFERVGRLLNEVGRQVQDEGVRLVYHNHMGGFGEAPDEVAKVMEASDPKRLDLLFDIAHYTQGGGDAVKGIARHRARISIVHLKDVVSPLPADTRPPHDSYKWVELGRGKVDVPGCVAALKDARFHGPAVIELDAVTDPAKTPKDCAALNKKYALETLGLSL